MKVNSSTISSTQLSQLFRSLSYAIDVGFLDLDSLHKLIKRTSTLLEQNALNNANFESFCNAFSKGQIDSKNWLIQVVNDLNLNLGVVYLCAGWHATLILNKGFRYSKIRNIDLSGESIKIANELHRDLIIEDWKYLSIQKNIHDINYQLHQFTTHKANGEVRTIIESPDTIINTSCEHISDFSKWYQNLTQDKLIILQSNNGIEISDHVNTCQSLTEFAQQTPMEKVLYSSELSLPKFTRYMRIGYK